MAKFLQDTVTEIAVTGSSSESKEAAQEFSAFFQKVIIIYQEVFPLHFNCSF